MSFRIGFGYDVHQLEDGRPFWLGGIEIPHTKGAVGHSDADVVIHAICDALLGAANLGDIGLHFSDTDAQYKGIDSKILLSRVCELISEKGYKIGNIDCSLSLEKPKMMHLKNQMAVALAKAAKISEEQISIKATTSEKMGFVGREEGVVCYAVALIEKK